MEKVNHQQGNEKGDKMNEFKDNSLSSFDDLLSDPFKTNESSTELSKEEKGEVKAIERLSPQYKEKAIKISEQINQNDHQAILQYGVAAQSELSKFSQGVLQHVQAKDTGPVGEVLTDLMGKIKQLNLDELSGKKQGRVGRFFSTISRSAKGIFPKYSSLQVEIEKIADQLEHTKQELYRDLLMLEKLYDKNKEYFDALNIYIAAAEHKLELLETETLPKLEQEALKTDNYLTVQEVNDVKQFMTRLDKRTYDLKLSRQIAIQSAPQIRMIQEVNQTLVEKIQSSILTAIPLWKNQVVIALTLLRQEKAMEAQREVTNTTNDLLLKNSELLKKNTVDIARENERGLVDIETLQKTQENLVETLEEVLQIQADGRTKRKEAERELQHMEDNLKKRLLDLT